MHSRLSKSVLLVEAHPEVREAVQAALQFEGYEVIAAPSPREALGRLDLGVKLALIVLDDVLDDMSRPEMGIQEAVHQLRRIPSLSTVPIVLLSGGAAQPTLDIQGVLRKPFTLEALLGSVKASCR